MGAKNQKIIQDFNGLIPYIEKLNKSGSLSLIELDIVKTKLQSIYDLLNTLNNESFTTSINSFEGSLKQVEPDVSNSREVSMKNDTLILLEVQNAEMKEVEKNKVQEKPSDVRTENIIVSDLHSSKEILAEKFKKTQPPINELLAQGIHKKDLSSAMQTKIIKDIESAIGINERFLFLRELFNGDSDLYSKTIQHLNNSSNFNEAFNHIHQNFSWDLEGETAQQLLDLVRRRYIIEED